MAGWGTISLISTLIYLLIANADNDDYFRIKDYFMEVLAIVLFIMASSFYLKLTVALHHETYDLNMLIWDNLMFGALPSAYINLQSNSTPGMMGLLKISYIFLPIFMISMRFMDAGKRIPINITGIFLGTAALGYCIYFIAPVCGPVYLLGERFPLDIPDLADVAGHATMPLAWPDFPRNGIPSLHMAWALSLALISVYLGTAARVWAGMALALTFCATLALGEHYVIDLIIAVPFSVFIQTLFTAVPEKRKPRRVALIIFSALITAVSILVALIPGYDLIASGPFWLAFWSVIMLMSLTVFHLLHKDAIN